MKRFFAIAFLALTLTAADAQNYVTQLGNITPGHVATWAGQQRIQDGGSGGGCTGDFCGAFTGTGLEKNSNQINLEPGTTSTIGGVKAVSPVTHQWVAFINGGQAFLSQPSITDIGALGANVATTLSQSVNSATGFVSPNGLASGTCSNTIALNAGGLPILGPCTGGLSPIANNTFLANISGSSQTPSQTTLTAFFDSVCSTTVGQFWVRMTSAWGCSQVGYYNPLWYSALCNGSNDDSSSIQNVLNAIAAAGGGALFIPSGTQCEAHGLTWSSANSLKVFGTGSTSKFFLNSTSQGLLTATSGTVEYDDFETGYPTQGAVSNSVTMFSQTNGFQYFYRLTEFNGGSFAEWNCGSGGAADHIYSQGLSNSAFTIDVSCTPGGQQFGEISLSNLQIQAGPGNNGSGIAMLSGDTFFLSNDNVAGFSIDYNATCSASHSYVDNIFGQNVFGDGAGGGTNPQAAWFISGAAGCFVGHIRLTNISANAMGSGTSGSGIGFYATHAYDISLTNFQALDDCLVGIEFDVGTKGFTLNGGTVSGNSSCNPGVTDGIQVLSGAYNGIIQGVKSGASPAGTTSSVLNTQRFNLLLAATTAFPIVATSNDLTGFASGGASLQTGFTIPACSTSTCITNNLQGSYTP